MDTVVHLSGVPLVTKFRLLLPEWPGRLCTEHQRRAAWRVLPAGRGPSEAAPQAAPRGVRNAASRLNEPMGQAAQRPTRRSLDAPIARVSDDTAVDLLPTGATSTDPRSRLGSPTIASNGCGSGRTTSSAWGPGGAAARRSNWQRKMAKHARGDAGGDGSGVDAGTAVWSQVRGADVETWTELVRKYGTTLGGAFAANALFRAAHFVDGAGVLLDRAGDNGRTRGLGVPPPPPRVVHETTGGRPAPLSAVDAATFSALVQQLLCPATEAAVAGQLDEVRGCRLLWALAKLSGGGAEVGGSVVPTTPEEARAAADSPGGDQGPFPGQQQTQTQTHTQTRAEGQNWAARRKEGAGLACRSTPTLPRSVMRGAGGRCVVALASQLLRQLAEDGRPEAAADGSGGGGGGVGGSARVASAPPSVGAAGLSPDVTRGPSGRAAYLEDTRRTGLGRGLNGRLQVMAMWGLARLAAEGHLRYGTVAASAALATGKPTNANINTAGEAVGRGELWDALCGALRPRLAGLQVREVSNAMWALASVRYCHHPVFGELAAALELHLAEAEAEAEATSRGRLPSQSNGRGCNVQDMANAVWALARAAVSCSEGPSPRLLGRCESAVLRMLPQLRAQHVASLLWSFATLRHRPTRHVLSKVPHPLPASTSTTSEALLPAAGSGSLAGPIKEEGAGSGTRVSSQREQQQQVRRSQQVQMNVYQLLETRAWELQIFHHEDVGLVAQVVWALVRERLADEKVLRVAARRLQVGATRLTLREAAMVASAYRMARYVDRELFESLLLRAASLPRHELVGSSHADVSIALLLRGLAWAGCYDQGAYARLCDAMRHHLPSIQPQPLALALWALAEAQHRQPDFLSPATIVAAAIVGRFSGGELSCVALSLARLGVHNAEFFSAAAVTLTALRGGGGVAATTAEAAEAARSPPLDLIPGEAAAITGAEETEEDLEEVVDEEEEGEEEEDEDWVASAASASAATQRRRRRGGKRYWLPRASSALQSTRWRRIDLLNPQELANVMAAFAISGNVDELLYYRAQIRTRRLLNASAVLRREVAKTAAAGGGGAAVAAEAALRRGDPVAGCDMSAAAITKLLWAFVAVGVQEPPLLRALAGRLRQLLQCLEPRDIAALAWALAVARLPDCNDLLSRAIRAASEHAQAFAQAELATVAWAAATVGILNPGLMDACARLVLAVPVTVTGAMTCPATLTTTVPGLKVLSDVAWAHSALRLHHPRLLAHVAELAEIQLAAVNATSAAAPAVATARLEETAPWLASDLELHHVVALLEAYATWASVPGDGSGSGAGSGGDCYHDGLFRAAAAVLLSRLDELTSDEVVTLTWCCASVLHALPPPPPPPSPSPLTTTTVVIAEQQVAELIATTRHCHHPVLDLLQALSEFIAATSSDSFLQPELAQLAQAKAMSAQYEAEAVAQGRQGLRPLVLPAALMQRMAGVWVAAPAAHTRRLVVELCAALDDMGFRDVQIDALSEDGLVPVDVGALGPPPPLLPQPLTASPSARSSQLTKQSHKPRSLTAGEERGETGTGLRRYAFLIVTPELQAVGQTQVYWGALAVRVRLLRARGWEVVVVPTPSPRGAGSGAGVGPHFKGRVDAGQQRQYVRELLRVVLLERAEREGSAVGEKAGLCLKSDLPPE